MNALQKLELTEIETIMNDEEYFLTGETEHLKQRFQITDINSLNWALRKISSINAQLSDEEKLYESEFGRIALWIGKQRDSAARSREFFEGLIAEYATTQREKDPKFKVSTPYGKLSYRKQKPHWDYVDETLVKYLEDNSLNDLIRVKKEPIKNDIKERFAVSKEGRLINQDTGEVIPGVVITERGDKLEIKVEG